jgi:hypothetical protein
MWFWSCVACVVLTMLIGFTWGGWVTGGTAEGRVASASEDARAELAAQICVHRFLEADDAKAQLAAFKEKDFWNRDGFVEDGGWVTFAGMKEPVDGAAELCAEQLADAELPAAGAATETAASEDTVAN